MAFGLKTLGLDGATVRARTSAALAASGLERLAERDPRSLSGGEQQRLVLAAVMARRPRALVLDEPLSMLDTAAAAAVVRDLAALRDAGVAVVAFEHRTALFAPLRQVRRMALPAPTRCEAPLPEALAPVAGVRLRCAGCASNTAGAPCCATSISTWPAARSSVWSAPTAPARRPCCVP